ANRERERITLYTQAIDQLGSEKRKVRLGGIYALERVARESDTDYQQSIEVLAAYIRENAPWRSGLPAPISVPRNKAKKRTPHPPARAYADNYEDEPSAEIRPQEDIQAAIGALRRRRFSHGQGETFRISLARTDLRGADL